MHTGTRALHRFGYRFPRFLLAVHTEDEVFEMTVAAAVGAAFADYDADHDRSHGLPRG